MFRFSATPTRDFNVNDLRIAIVNYIVSKQSNDKLLIRIDDIQKDKNIPDKEKEIINLLSLFSIDHERVIYQSENLKYHQKLAMQLMSQKKAFACFCSDEKLEELKQKAKEKGKTYSYDGFCSTLSDETVLNCNAPFTVRIQKPQSSISFNDQIKGNFEFKPFEIDSFFILNHDKIPTFDFASALDDMLYNISNVISDEDYLSSAPKQIYTRSLLNYTQNINYAHLPKILNSEDISVKYLVDNGYLPSAIANYLLNLGYKTPNDIFTLEEAITWFDIEKLSTKEIVFDIEGLKVINKQHLKNLDSLRLSKILGFVDEDIGKLAKLYLDDISTINELKKEIDAIFNQKTNNEEYSKIIDCLKAAPYFDTLDKLLDYLKKELDLDKNEAISSLKKIIYGHIDGPDLEKTYPLIKNYLGEIIK